MSLLLSARWYSKLPLAALLACALAASPARALDPSRAITQYAVRSWSSKEGLPQNSVHAIQQTRDGYLWIATEEGLVRFDGTEFTLFNHKNTPELRLNFISALWEAKDGSLWAGTLGGGAIRYQHGHFTSFTQLEGLADDWVISLCEDARGDMWFTGRKGLDRWHAGRFEHFGLKQGLSGMFLGTVRPDPEGGLWIAALGGGLDHFRDGRATSLGLAQGLTDTVVTSVLRDRHADIWVGTQAGGLDRIRDGRVVASYGRRDGLPSVQISSLLEDREGTLWVGTDHGLCRFQGGRFTTLTPECGLLGSRVSTLFEDREGNLWVGTHGGGLNRLQNGKFLPITVREGLASDMVSPICQAPDGTMWVGSFDKGLTRIRDGKYTHFGLAEGLPPRIIISLCVDRAGTLWVGTAGGGLLYFHNERFLPCGPSQGYIPRGAFASCLSRSGDLWVGSNGQGVFVLRDGRVIRRYTEKDGAGNGFLRYLIEGRDGSIWMATSGTGVIRFHDGKFRQYRAKDGLASDIVASLYEDADGALWVGSMGGGLSRIKNGHINTINSQHGLFDDLVYGIAEDGSGRLWMSCNNGIFTVPRRDLNDFVEGRLGRVTCTAYGEQDGMRVHECNSSAPAVTRTSDGRIWFATLGGVAVVDPAHLPVNRVVPTVVVERVLVDKQEVRLGNSVSMGPGHGEVEVHYSGLSYTAPEKMQFHYRLDGFDRHWTDAGSRRVAYYTNLPPGRYTFRVAACNNDGLWNDEGASFTFRLEPHFYQTWWFDVLCGLAAFLVVWGAHRKRVEGLRALVDERTRSKDALEASNSRLEAAMADLQRAQSGLIEQERLRALGQMASGIAHDFNNALAPIVGFSELLLLRPELLEDKERLLDYLETIHTAGRDAGSIVNRLREFYRPRERDEVFPLIPLNGVVETALTMTQPKWKAQALANGVTIEVRKTLPELPLIPASDSDLREVLTNLIFNAVDAMPDGGTLSLVTAIEDRFVTLEVGDTGTGMSEEVRRRCLEPFFTTKGERGTGLGLPMVYGIVQRHRGVIDIHSGPGKGTRFVVKLPIDADAAQEAPDHVSDEPLPPMHILVVDDEPKVLEFVSRYLETDQHTVETASDGMDGLKKFYSGTFDLVIMDRAMPRMSGDQLAAAVKQASPGTPVILLTGFGELMMARNERPDGVDVVVSKPVSLSMLRRAMGKVVLRKAA